MDEKLCPDHIIVDENLESYSEGTCCFFYHFLRQGLIETKQNPSDGSRSIERTD